MLGNGRMARNVCELAIRNHAIRVSQIENPTVEQLVTILPEDIWKWVKRLGKLFAITRCCCLLPILSFLINFHCLWTVDGISLF